MREINMTFLSTVITALFVIGSMNQSIVSPEKSKTSEPTVVSTFPSDGEVDVARNAVIEITFSQAVDSMSMENSTFTLMQGSESVEGTMEYSDSKGMFTTQKSLKAETVYTAKMTTSSNKSDDQSDEEFYDEESDYRTVAGDDMEWSFTTGGNSEPVGTVDLGSAAEYVILTKSAIHNDSTSEITGAKGFDPDFKSSKDKDDKTAYWLKNEDVDKEAVRRDTARERSVDREHSPRERGSGTDNLDAAFDDMMAAYDNAEERSPVDFFDHKVGTSSDHKAKSAMDHHKADTSDMSDTTDTTMGQQRVDIHNDNPRYGEGHRSETEMDENRVEETVTLEPGVYKWDESVEISTNIKLSGSADDVWIFQIADGLTVNRDVEITLADGAVAEHVFWQVAGEVNLGESSHFEGIILSHSGITMKNGATLNGRMLTQEDVTLDDNTISEPQGPASVQTTSRDE